jgi:hypothetical protein
METHRIKKKNPVFFGLETNRATTVPVQNIDLKIYTAFFLLSHLTFMLLN